jgi:DNA-binding CsgD family transcriptional regulator
MKTIAGTLDIGIQTVAKHRTRVLGKMQVRNEAELVRLLADYPLEG